MKLIKKVLFTFLLFIFGVNLFVCSFIFADGTKTPYDAVISSTVDGTGLESAISYQGDIITDQSGGQLINEQVKLLIGYVIDVFIVIGIAIAFLGGYKIMTSSSEDQMKEGIRLVGFGVLGILIMMSARFIASGLVGDNGVISGQFITSEDGPNGVKLAKNLYDKIFFPFIKVALYLVMGALFFIMAAKVITFVISTDDTAKKKAGGMILWCVIGIFIIMGSKQIVEAVMGNQDSVLYDEARWIDEMGNPIEEFNSIELVSQIINWAMGLTMFIVVILIVIQGYRMFAKPDDPKNRERLKKTMLYVVIGVLVIGAAYVISNVLVINQVS